MIASEVDQCYNNYICASPRVARPGDSGSPLFYYSSTGKSKIIGILSDKGNVKHIFTRVPHFISWINVSKKKMLK